MKNEEIVITRTEESGRTYSSKTDSVDFLKGYLSEILNQARQGRHNNEKIVIEIGTIEGTD